MQVPIQIDVNGQAILGMLHIPSKPLNKMPLIIMCYGFNGNRCEEHRMMVLTGRLCEQRGIFLLRLDYRGQGISDGDFWEVDIDRRIQDINSAIDFLNGCFGLQKHKLFLLGFSDGARIASPIALIRKEVEGLILWNPVFATEPGNSLYSIKRKTIRIRREPISGTFVYPLYGLWVKTDYLRQLNKSSAYKDFKKFQGSKLCIFGSKDQYTTKFRRLIMDQPEHNLELKIIEGANHLFGTSSFTYQTIDSTLNYVEQLCTNSKGYSCYT